MHYTGMAAATFTPADLPDLDGAVHVTGLGFAGIVTVTLIVLVTAVTTALIGRLKEKIALLDELFEHAPEAIILLNAAGRVIRVNREFTGVFGYTPQEALGRPLDELIAPGESGHELQRHVQSLVLGRRVDAERIRQRKDGSQIHVLAGGVPVSLPGGETAVYMMYRDITERKSAEIALRAQETERRHLARELHDQIGQLLTGLRLSLRPDGDSLSEALSTRFQQARSILDEMVVRVRRLSFDLRPGSLDQLGLIPALLAFFEQYTAQTGVLVDFKHQGVEGRLAPGVETGAYRIVQEALTNVARHSSVTGVTVRIWVDGDSLNLHIEDRGRGFDPWAALKVSQASGLVGMHERVWVLGGRINIESSPGNGATITAGLPLNKTSSV